MCPQIDEQQRQKTKKKNKRKTRQDEMVHRLSSDSRLLSNLITHEKDYSKQLSNLLDSSYASLASLSAYAAATGQPVSRVITCIAGHFSSADDALRRYKTATEAWCEQLKTLKDMETQVSTIIRDREILCVSFLSLVQPCPFLFPLASLVCSRHLKTRSLQRTRTYHIAIPSVNAPLPYLPCLSPCLPLFPPPTNSLPHRPNSKHANPTLPRMKKSYKSPAR